MMTRAVSPFTESMSVLLKALTFGIATGPPRIQCLLKKTSRSVMMTSPVSPITENTSVLLKALTFELVTGTQGGCTPATQSRCGRRWTRLGVHHRSWPGEAAGLLEPDLNLARRTVHVREAPVLVAQDALAKQSLGANSEWIPNPVSSTRCKP